MTASASRIITPPTAPPLRTNRRQKLLPGRDCTTAIRVKAPERSTVPPGYPLSRLDGRGVGAGAWADPSL